MNEPDPSPPSEPPSDLTSTERRAHRPAGAPSLAASFSFAITGLAEAALRQRNLRIHLAAGVLASCFAAVAPLSTAERAIIVACVALVIGAEVANSALEAIVDLVSPGFDPRARIAKDCAAAAVLALAAASVVAFVTIAWPVLSVAALLAHRVEAAAALGAAVATGALPTPIRRSRATDLALAIGALACLAVVARGAASPGPLSAAALLLILSGESARRARRNPSAKHYAH